jgi:F-box-like
MRGILSSTACASCGSTTVADATAIPSPLPDRVGTNYVPSSSEANLIRSTLSQVQCNISLLDHESDRLRAMLDRVSHNRKTLLKFSAEYQALLSPTRCLPPEVLAEIFYYCSPENWIDDNPHDKRATMLSSHVCRLWRQVALSMPRLWSSLSLEIRTANYESSLSLAKSWLSRSGGCPLKLRILCFDRSRNLQFLVDTILPLCHRWQNLYIVVLFAEIDDFVAAIGHVPRLEMLDLSVLDSPDFLTTRPLPVRIFESAPKLRNVCLSDGIIPHGVQLPWDQLTEFRVGLCGVYDCLEALTWLPNLVKFGVDLAIVKTPPSGAIHHVIQLPHLTTMTLFPRVNPGYFFDHLALPSLADFEYYDEVGCTWKQRQFISLLLRSSCSLRRLCLAAPRSMKEHHLIQVLEHTPDLRELHVAPLSMSSSALARLTRQTTNNENAPCLVTKLHTFKIFHQLHFDAEALADMVESRWRLEDDTLNSSSGSKHSVSRIHTVQVTCARLCVDAIAPSTLVRFREFARGGLAMQLTDEDDSPLL